MVENSYVIVIPSRFAQKKSSLLLENIKKILKIKNQQLKSVKKDCSLIIIDANDPVFASSAINFLFGIQKVAIAKRVENKFETIIAEITKIGSNLLLKGDSFYVKIEGSAKGFLPKDLEMASTSSIIEKSSKIDVHPGTESNHNKLLYTYLTKSYAYICIFLDEGLGGIPYGAQKQTMLCPIFDELSAVSCIETIKQGFNVEILVCYSNDSHLTDLVKMINQIIPRTIKKEIKLEFFKINLDKPNSKNYYQYFQVVMGILRNIAKKRKINHISLSVTPLIFPSKIIDEELQKFYSQKIVPFFPLGALEDEIYINANEIGIGKFLSKIDNLAKVDFAKTNEKNISKYVVSALKVSKIVPVKIGPNNVHEILDELIDENKTNQK